MTSSSIKRRQFLKAGTAIFAGTAAYPWAGGLAWAGQKPECSSPTARQMGWLVGIAQYTFRRFDLYEALEKTSQLGIRHIEPAFFLKLDKSRPDLQVNENLPPEIRKELKQKLADFGISMSSFYSNLNTDADQAKKIFEFCKDMGAGTVVAEPEAETFDMIEKLCDEHEINVAVHNHPKRPKSKYWRPENVLAVCEGRGSRIGACCDTGHWVRSGLDPVACLKKLEGRILSFHLKDVAEKGVVDARDVPVGQGAADYAAVLKELKRQGYRGVTTIEYEHESPQLMEDVAKCAAFVEKTAKNLR